MTKTITNATLLFFVTLALLFTCTGTTFADNDNEEHDANARIAEVETLLDELTHLLDEAIALDDDDLDFDDYLDILEDGQELYDEAITEQTKEDWKDVLELSNETYELLQDAVDDLTDDLADSIEDAMDFAAHLIEVADAALHEITNKNSKYDAARVLFDQAESTFDDATDAQDDDNYNEAKRFAADVETVLSDALDEVRINLDDYLEAEEERSNARDSIETAQDAIDEAEALIADTTYTDADQEAAHIEYLQIATTYLEEAEGLYDDDAYTDATANAEQAVAKATVILQDPIIDTITEKEISDGAQQDKAQLQQQVDQLLKLIKLLTQLLALQQNNS